MKTKTHGFRFLSLAILTVLSACGSDGSKSALKSEPQKEPPVVRVLPLPVDSSKLNGVWEGETNLQTYSFSSQFTFTAHHLHVDRTCKFPSNRVITVSADASALDTAENHITIVGGLFSTTTVDSDTCTIDVSASTEFLVKDGKLIVGLLNQYRESALRKTSEL